MTEHYIRDLKPGMDIPDGIYVLRCIKLLPFKNGAGYYLGATLADKTGQIEVRVWEKAEEIINNLKTGDVVKVAGQVTEYNGVAQLQITSMEKVECNDPERFIPSTGVSVAEVEIAWKNLMEEITTPGLRILLSNMAKNKSFINAFAQAPAAKQNHHARLGGLWEHSYSMVKAADKITKVYPDLDRDLLVTGALLHDVGKVEEYTVGASIGVANAGRLLGHIVLGIGIVERFIAKVPGFPETLRLKLLHMIASHHGKYEWQSPKKPKFPEAAILHQLDMLDCQRDMFDTAIAEEQDSGETWTGWVRALERYIFCG